MKRIWVIGFFLAVLWLSAGSGPARANPAVGTFEIDRACIALGNGDRNGLARARSIVSKLFSTPDDRLEFFETRAPLAMWNARQDYVGLESLRKFEEALQDYAGLSAQRKDWSGFETAIALHTDLLARLAELTPPDRLMLNTGVPESGAEASLRLVLNMSVAADGELSAIIVALRDGPDQKACLIRFARLVKALDDMGHTFVGRDNELLYGHGKQKLGDHVNFDVAGLRESNSEYQRQVLLKIKQMQPVMAAAFTCLKAKNH